ncbi:MAG: pirin family protein [Clostridia bacterium]|nr:pirin family protein [Clostridia bacterium]
MSSIISKEFMEFHWKTQDPFLFCAHHFDQYPKGTDQLGPAMPLSRRNLGQDFDLSNSWKMYHGHEVPGFPQHPHRGFETVTIVLEGFVDHSDSMGASGRYGEGDVQWMTAGKGMQHAEMFPLLNQNQDNPLHLFQVWLNLPQANKFVEPHYKMFWHEDIPVVQLRDASGDIGTVRIIAGRYDETHALAPTPDSWAAQAEHHVDIFLVTLMPDGTMDMPAKSATQKRALYFYNGTTLEIDGESLEANYQAFLSSEAKKIKNIGTKASFLVLQAEPINEPVAQYGPFVMNTQAEIKQAYDDYQRTGFGGWPWERVDPTHGRDKVRFAKYGEDLTEEKVFI